METYSIFPYSKKQAEKQGVTIKPLAYKLKKIDVFKKQLKIIKDIKKEIVEVE